MKKHVRFAVIAALVGVLGLAGAPLAAAPCRDAKGRFVKCSTSAPPKPIRCRNEKGKYAKCGAPGAKPA